jgi:hypothetical protein
MFQATPFKKPWRGRGSTYETSDGSYMRVSVPCLGEHLLGRRRRYTKPISQHT